MTNSDEMITILKEKKKKYVVRGKAKRLSPEQILDQVGAALVEAKVEEDPGVEEKERHNQPGMTPMGLAFVL